jgi:formylglycine-generating enzyme required for sulfatase activity
MMEFDVLAAGKHCFDPKDTATREFNDCVMLGEIRFCAPRMVVLPKGDYLQGDETRPLGSPEQGCADQDTAKSHRCPRAEAEVPPEGERFGTKRRKVTIGYHVAVGKFEVTFAEWDACVADGGCKYSPPETGWGRGRQPVFLVSWDDVTTEYLPWLNRRLGLSGDKAYRLLSEAEWEYAARGVTSASEIHMKHSWGNDVKVNGRAMANCVGCGSRWETNKQTAPVGSFPHAVNSFGLHDMHGNVWEWVQDCYVEDYQGVPADGSAAISPNCSSRVLRGGIAAAGPEYLSASVRVWTPHNTRVGGFRLSRAL